jgi:histidinol-phosphate aminotransferase
MNIKRFVKPNIYSLTAYQAKEIPCRAKLDANESPYGFMDAYKAARSVKTNRYPDPEAKALKKLISKETGVKPESILQGNGSDELIYYLITAFGGPVLYPVPTFSMYGIITQALGEKKVEVPLNEDFDLDEIGILTEIRRKKPRLIFLSSPNNPTGNCFSSETVLKIVETASLTSLVIVDEAYQPFASDKGFIPLLGDYKNLIIMRTLSKMGLAGLRVGFLIADDAIIEQVNKVRLPFNLNAFSQAIAMELLLKNKKALKRNIRIIVSERGKLFNELAKMEGIRPYPSEANFILFRVEDTDRVFDRLLKKGVLVRNMKGVVGGCLRVTVGTPDENRRFINALKLIMKIKCYRHEEDVMKKSCTDTLQPSHVTRQLSLVMRRRLNQRSRVSK